MLTTHLKRYQMKTREELEAILDEDEGTKKSMERQVGAVTQQSLAAEEDLDAVRLGMLQAITVFEMVYQRVTTVQKQMEASNDNGATQ